jgi:hypothetical protein
LFLPESKTGRKTIVLNAPALTVLSGLNRLGSYVITGDNPEKPRADLKRPWEAVSKRAGLAGVRLQDRRVDAAHYLQMKFGLRCAKQTLAKLAVIGGGPKYT